MKRAIGYLRVSGLGQVDKDGEQRQSDSIRQFCAANGLQPPTMFFEKGVSGTVEGLDRPVFREILEAIAQSDLEWKQEHTGSNWIDFGGVEAKRNRPCIVIERLDRLARELMVQEIMLRECRERGIEVYAADQPFLDLASNDVDPSRKLFRQIMGALAEWEKSALVLKLRKARDRKRADNGRCEGPIPFHLRPVGEVILARINELRNTGKSLPATVAILNHEGFVTCNGKQWTKRALCHFVRKAKGWKEK